MAGAATVDRRRSSFVVLISALAAVMTTVMMSAEAASNRQVVTLPLVPKSSAFGPSGYAAASDDDAAMAAAAASAGKPGKISLKVTRKANKKSSSWAKSLTAQAHSTVSFLNSCGACAGGQLKVLVYYQPLFGPGRLSTVNNGYISQGFFSIPTGGIKQLVATTHSSAGFYAYCDTGSGSKPFVLGSAVGAFNLLESTSEQCVRVPIKSLKLPRPGEAPQDLIVDFTCGQQSSSAGVPADFQTSSSSSEPVPFSSLSLRLDCSSCRTARVMAHYQPVLGAPAGPADTSPANPASSAGWANTPGWFELSNRAATPTKILATQGSTVHVYAYCTSGSSLAWAGDIPDKLPASYQGCGPSFKMMTLQLSGQPGSDFVGRLACDSSISEDKCLGVSCSPVGPCQRSSTCSQTTGQCEVTYVNDWEPCLGKSGLCTNEHICDACAMTSCKVEGPCMKSNACDPATGTCQPVYAAKGESCLGGLGKCSESHECERISQTCTGAAASCSLGPCDAAASCNPATNACQVTAFIPAGQPCRGGKGTCTADHACDICSGTNCQPDALKCQKTAACDANTGLCIGTSFFPEGSSCPFNGSCNSNHVCIVPRV